jgi:long-chain acyl-CoA synthetase
MIVRSLACGLQALGVSAQDRVSIMAYNCPEWLWSDFAILGSGAVTVTIYPTLSAGEMKYIINNSGSKVLFVRDRDGVDKALAALDEMPGLEKVIVMQDAVPLPGNDKFVHLSQVRQLGMRYMFAHPYAYEKSCDRIKIWDLATIVYTSGTTGTPKGAMHSHYAFLNAMQTDNLRYISNDFMIDEDDVLLSVLPLSHTYERQCGQMQTIGTGGTIAYAEQPTTLMRDLQIFNPTWFNSVPRIFERIYVAMRDAASATVEGKAAFEKAVDIGLRVVDYQSDENGFVDMSFNHSFVDGLPDELKADYEWADAAVFSKVRALLGKNYRFSTSASAGLPAKLCKLFMAVGVRIAEGYGLTETMNAINFSHMRAILPGSMGPATYFHELKLAEDGEILVRGGNIFLGYYNNPSATAEVFDPDGFFHTGDIAVTIHNARLNTDYYKIIDRKKSIMVLDTGKNVPRAKVEGRFSTAFYAEQVCVVGDDRKFVTAVVVPKFDRVLQTLKTQGISFDESQMMKVDGVTVKVGEDFTHHPEVRKLIDIDIAEANQGLEVHEEIKKFSISNRVFLPDMDEVTPTLKVKHRNVIKNFALEIEELYEQGS